MYRKFFILCFALAGINIAAEELDIVPDSEPVENVSVSELRSSTNAKNPFYAKKYIIDARNEKTETVSSSPVTSSKYVYMSESDGKNVTIWEINQADAKNGETERFTIGQTDAENTRFTILKNGASNKATYPHKLIIPNKSRFVSAFFLDYLQDWGVEAVSGRILTIKASQNSRSISGTVTVPAEQTFQIELNSNDDIDSESVLNPAAGDTVAIVIDSKNKGFSKQNDTNNLTIIRKEIDLLNKPGKLKYITGKIK